jgi:hypothetical protein
MTADFMSDERIEKALGFLTDSAKPYADAKGRRIWLEEKRKVVKAQLFQAATGNNVERESAAYTSAPYITLLDELREAVCDEERLRALRIAAEAKIEVWRSMESSRRAANV